MSGVRSPTPRRQDRQFATAAEIRGLADKIERVSDRLAVLVAGFCGLRAGEV